jgi:hypothetical protein
MWKLLLAIALLIGFSTPCRGGTRQDIICLAKNIYFEASNQSYVGQQAVAWVTLNRVHSGNYPNTICGTSSLVGRLMESTEALVALRSFL